MTRPTESVNPTIRHIPFRELGTSEVHLRYLEEDRDLEPFLGMRPRDPGDVMRHAATNARRLVPPGELAGALEAYAERHGAPEAVLDNARSLADGETFVVVTGQQPGLLGGPLFALHKAATAVRLARELSARRDGPRVVPLFWNHTDDHDLDEVNRTFLVNSNQDLQRFRLPLQHSGKAVRHIAAGHLVEEVLAAAGDILPASEFRDWAFEPFRPRHPDEGLGDGMARMLFRLFGRHGLLVIEPRDLPESAFGVLGRWWTSAPKVRNQVRSVCDHLGALGIDVTLDPGATLMFQMSGGRRVPLSDGETVARASDLSPGAMLRPLWQDACLPTVGFVVGPGELAYRAVVGPLYRTLGVPVPALVPRASLTLVEPSQKKLLKRFGWDIPDLQRGIETLAGEVLEKDEEGAEGDLDALGEQVRAGFETVLEGLRRSDRQMVGQAERCRGKVLDEIGRLAQKVRNSRQNREGTGMRQIRRLCNNLRPRSRMQERVLPPLPYLVSHGEALADCLIDAADPFSVDHGVLEF